MIASPAIINTRHSMLFKNILYVSHMAFYVVRISRIGHIRKEHRSKSHSNKKEEQKTATQPEAPSKQKAKQGKKYNGANIRDLRQK